MSVDQTTEFEAFDSTPFDEDEVYVFPSSFGQRRFWFLDQFEPGSPYYNIPLAIRVRGAFDVQIFKKVINEIIERHEILRTTFWAQNGEPMQIIHPEMKLEIPLVDLTSLAADKKDAEIKRLATVEARTPFDLAKGPLFRVKILKAGENDHVVLITMHHIISDGWSIGVLVKEITAIYAAFSQGLPNPLPELEIQYADFAEWQREYLQGEVLEEQLQFWKEQLGDNPPPLELPTDRPRPQIQSNVGSSERVIFPAELTNKLNQLARREGGTLFMVLSAALKTLLARYSGQKDISIGTPIANRNRAEIEPLIGLFINTLVLRSRLDDNPTFREFLQREKNITLNAYDHQDLPFEYLVDALQPARDMSYPPLFQVMLILQNAPMKGTRVGDISFEQIDVDMGTSTHDLTFSITEGSSGLIVDIEYNTDLFDRSTIQRLGRHFKQLCEALVEDPEQRVLNVNFLAPDERQRILVEWNATQAPRDPHLCIHHLFEKRAAETPDAPAVVAPDQTLTYDQLNRQANQLARLLHRQGVRPETVVGVMLERQAHLLVAVLGVLKAGGAYLPLDPSYPEERLNYMLEDAGVTFLITQSSLKDLLPHFEGRVLLMDEDRAQFTQLPDDNPAFPVTPENLVYMIYTSGSTGKAKGTMIQHRSLVNAYLAWETAYELRTRARSHLQMASFSFDVFSGDWTRGLCSGGKLVLTPREILLEAAELYDLMRSQQVTIAEFVPAVLRNLIQYLEETNQKLDFFRNLIAGSDIWYVSEYKKFLGFTGPETRLINSFGLTEATIDSTYFESRELNMPGDRLVPIGKPFENMTVYILDEFLQPVPIGVRGELYVGGMGLARGYFNRPDLTAERFLPDPFSSQPGARMYKTGDVARYLPDGNIEFLGRADDQVKIRGFRVELGEIETALNEHPDIQSAAVVLREDTPGDKKLIGYFVPAAGKSLTNKELRHFLLDRLPEYMVPSAFVELEEMPLTPNGKVNRRALPRPDQKLLLETIEMEYEAPRTPTEEVLAEIYSQLLSVEKVGSNHNFFELGGHSLLATQLVSRIKERFGIDLPLRHVFEKPTVGGLAMAIDQQKLASEGIQIPPIVPVSRDQELPLSFAQQRLWFLAQLEPDSPFYNLPETYRIVGPLKVDVLQRSLNEVIKRHEALRTTFHNRDGEPAQVIHEPFEVKIPVTDLTHLPPAERQAEVERLVNEQAWRSIAIDRLPLFHLELVRTGINEHVIILIMHHIIGDNWSTNVLLREMAIIYDAFSRGDDSPLPPLQIQYADFAYWQRNWLKGEVLEKEIEFWKEQLAGAPPVLELPTDRPRPAVQTFNGSYKTFHLSPEVSSALKKLAHKVGATEFMTLLALFQTMLYRYSGQDDIVIGTPIANRNHPEIENLIGFFVNTLAIRTRFEDRPSFLQLLKQVRETALAAYAHQDLPFEKLVDALQPERNLSHSPIFQVMFALQTSGRSEMQAPHSELQLQPIEAHSKTAKFDMTLFMLEEADHFSGALEFNTDLFDEDTIERFVRHFTRLAEALVQQPDTPVDRIDFLPAEEKRLLLEAWNGKQALPVLTGTVVDMFERQAAASPEAIAVEMEGQRWTYAELNQRANQLAHYLLARGVQRDQLIGVAVERSPQMLAALLGILKAGAAYVPLDVNYPQERLKFMIEDAGLKLIITSEQSAVKLPAHQAALIKIDTDWLAIATGSEANPGLAIEPQNLCYVIYTSGSTGRPKGTLIHHQGLSNYLNWIVSTYPVQKGIGSLVHSTLAFDATVTAIYSPLITGKTVYLLPDDTEIDALGEALLRYRNFSLIKITPAHLELLSKQIPPHEAADLTHAFIIGGENLTADQIEFWQQHAPETLLFNEYGPTETVVGCVVFEARQWHGSGSVPIGQAIFNTRVYVLDDHLQPTPIGVPGELYIGGIGVARGYLKRPDLTAERFIPYPFSNEPGARLYKTGDLVRYLKNGQLEFIGRVDHQVKIRGYRIELGEIENVLQENDQVQDAVAVVRSDFANDPRLVAYIIPADKETFDEASLRAFLKERLPDYMVPGWFVLLERFPLTPNGKIDRKALPRPDYAQSEKQEEWVAPRTPDEEILAGIWQEILHLPQVGVHNNFFELGGHSLLATQLMSRIREAFGVELPLKDLFEAPTIAELTLKIEQARLQTTGVKIPPLTRQPRSGQLPLSFAQQRLWFLDQLSPDSPFYNIPAAVRIKGQLNVQALEKAVNEIIRRHEVLRTIFVNNNGQPAQKILDDVSFELPIIDLQNESDRDEKVRRLLNRDAMQPFKLDRWPLFRLQLVKLSEHDFIFMFTMHHIISDGWSTSVFMREVGALYEAFSKGLPSPLPELPIQYADFAAWQRSWLKDDVLQEQLNYWKEKIGINPPVLNLPLDHPRPPVQTFNGDAVAGQLPEDISGKLNRLAQQYSVTPFMALLAVFQTLLHHYANQDEILVGSPIANRNYRATEDLIGFFVNTLVLRSDFNLVNTFEELLAQVRETTLGAYAHQDLPFEQLVEVLQPERDMSHSPLFQVMFVLQNTPPGSQSMEFPTIRLEVLEAEERTAKFDLTLVMAESPEGYFYEFEYNTDLFEKSTIERMARHFEILLKQLVEKPAQPLARLELVSGQEKKQIVEEWNQTDAALPEQAVIQALFEQTVEQFAGRPALVYKDQTLTFKALNEKANRLAHYLRARGIKVEIPVAISVERSPEMVIGLLAILKAGGVYLPVDPAYPPERIAYIVQDARPPLLLTQEKLKPLFEAYDVQILTFEALEKELAGQPSENPPIINEAENLAYMIYTSGSTGQPKGAMLAHCGLVNLTLEQIKDFALQPESRVLQFASFSFDASVSEIFTTLVSGAALYLIDRDEMLDVAKAINRYQISVITLPPSVSSLINPQEVPSLKTLISAGEACSVQLAQKWHKHLRFLNAYGPTENTVCASRYFVTEKPKGSAVPIGRPIGNVELYILNKEMMVLPVGVPGELYIGGVNLARGYLNRPDLTAERFVPHPFARKPGQRLYKTGDLARFLPDGNIEFLGRIDFQVKIRGFRIELEEIENVLMQHPQVEDAVVLVREDQPGQKLLAAYCVASGEEEPDAEALKAFCKKSLPDYMTPQAILFLEAFPLTPNGKIDRRALPAPDYEALQAEKYVAPRTSEEEALAAIFAGILNLEKVSVTESFFNLGGHSLLATQLASRIRDEFNVEIPLISIFENPTVAQLVTVIEEQRLKQKGPQLPPFKRIPRDQDIPLSFAQQRLWFLDQLAPDNATYNIPTALKISGRFNLPVFEKTLNFLVERHETLRTTFANKNGTPVQVIKETLSIKPAVVDLTHLPEKEREREALRLATEDAMEPFDLEIGPLFRVKVLKLADDQHVVLFNMHHIISDGWSVSILIREFAQVYESYLKEMIPPLPDLPIQYADFAVWQREWLSGDVLQEQIDYWKSTIGLNPEPLNLPTDFPRPAVQTFNGSSLDRLYPKELLERLKAFSRENGATLFMTLLAAFEALLHRYSGQDSILVGSPIANRRQTELENLIGFFVNNLVLKGEFDDDPDFVTLLQRVRKNTLEAYAHQDLPFENLVEILQPERDMSHAPIFQVMFVMQNTPVQPVQLSDVRLEPIIPEQKIAKYDLSLVVMETEDGLFAEFEYNTDLFRKETIERLHNHFQKLLEDVLQSPQKPVSTLSLITEQELKLFTREWNRIPSEPPLDVCIQTLFEQRAARTPDKTAVVYENERLTFEQLNIRANRLAHYLREIGVGPEKIVAISLERGQQMIISLLAVLKAGGAYLPIDPEYPSDRLNYMLKDSRAKWLITSQQLKEKFSDFSGQLIIQEEIESVLKAKPADNPQIVNRPQNLAYIIYTSGSTGRPKGVMLQHRGLVNLVFSLGGFYGVNAQSRTLQFASFSFDASVEEIFNTLINGATLYLIDRQTLLSGTGLVNALKSYKITNVTLPPSLLNVLNPQDFPHLKNITSAGEACTPEIANKWAQGRRFVNGYGPTENTVCATVYNVEEPLKGNTVPIGHPIHNVQVYVLNRAMIHQPIGVPGELYIGGPGLARGYLNRPDLTAERFVPNPFSEKPGERLYRTGDLVRFLPDGNLEFLGRIDKQVKIRGFRVELGEIEAAIRQHKGVKGAAVNAVKTTTNETALAAYLLVEEREKFDLAALKQEIKKILPDYMVPAAFILLDEFPLTPNGKINYRALPVPQFDQSGEVKQTVKARNTLEARLVDIWKEVLGVTTIGVTDSFFELGGHSLLAMKLLTAVEQKLGKDVNLVSFFREPTIEHMARLIEEDAPFESGATLVKLKSGDDRQPLFFVHPSGGSVHHYAELAKLLKTHRSVYGIQAQGLDGKMPLHQTVEDMASAYIQTIKQKQPHGPYLISSWSLGVIIVHEMARQFKAMGDEVALVLQLDQGPDVTYEKPADNAEMLVNMFKRYFKLDIDYLRTLDEASQFKFVIKKAKKHKVIPRFVRLNDFKRYILVNETQIMAWVNYRQKPYEGEIVLLRSEENAKADPPDLGWAKMVQKVRIIDVPGDHISMLLQPHVQIVADKIDRLLKDL
ncbi:amino acid adenylation domain protein [Caldithrix abyssi DSM 13497]|uniref:Amino acid adenylation domain protein n=1 Tax=Caldithrix abyssi DSM 13497 TaxID=880073 RepID=H1XP54_CALAY|nr:non-ribosomal peptide synthetase [Caldithrix abyssi]APF18136.1 amino acid adenylation domain-containing protein [Caldithrix abyssi DSM 13497]EHO42169.1 amino acid adenylation domain protein [Caldithrix abyssi DSM 13497]